MGITLVSKELDKLIFGLMVALEKSGLAKISGLHPLGTMNVCTNFMAIHLIVVELFSLWQKWWTNQQTDVAMPRDSKTGLILFSYSVSIINFCLISNVLKSQHTVSDHQISYQILFQAETTA